MYLCCIEDMQQNLLEQMLICYITFVENMPLIVRLQKIGMRFRKPEDVLLNSFSPTKVKFSGQQIRNNLNKLAFF